MKKETYIRLNRMSADEMEELIGRIAEEKPAIEKNNGWWELDIGDGEPLEGFDIVGMLEYKGWLDEAIEILEEE